MLNQVVEKVKLYSKKLVAKLLQLWQPKQLRKPETSRFAGETIPKTTSFIGVKVGEARKQAQEAKAAEQEVKQAVEQAKEVAKQSEETKKQIVQEQQKKAQAEAREKAVEELGEEKVQEIEEKLNESIPEPEPPTLPERNAVRETFRSLFNRDEVEEDATPI
jgi:predicted transcriptional regulator